MVNESTKVKTMKKALKIIFAGTLLFTFATAPLRAQTNAPAENASNAAVAHADAATNAPTTNSELASAPASVAEHKPKKTGSDGVVIDNTGLHLGGAQADAISFANAIENLSDDAVPLAGIAIAFLIPVCIIGIRYYAIVRDHRNLYREGNETVRAMIEKGTPMTPELMESVKGKQFPPVPKPPNLVLCLA